ncbi:MAG: dihydroorotase [Pseudanabaena sp.]|jgi:dihydroorotase|nr:dihydroorotase [Pseudanabaena sp. M090S1SP2A07QC]MCA6507305.1 dihydroorotase [Pseudanabaena sp. M172S2SP2A07QC]MCA6509592.1 dihydroorotase [Pseudanabaena sp. M109S1SP2A07QC]MCA6519223.1 dihydroorotase [Pseudanabaena sp. M110S1SP2A07QC]MCA6520740.1 dihydroorotase [Pseudanabaena sp. M051S1SP2A07QC]MCA6525386.1 dihydroorotase [Pseudanabaena sp. M179S2SP2A07QC]MCA6528457.1 dihydroorotase [Pseudanabaena sp. M125S2SP2A07QC]MCA6535493.1 dihydroorotase [Pseudanabaena sp. M176S2SP2A07QC]MCA653861
MSLENSIIYPVLFKQVRILSADSSSNIAEPFADVFVDSDRQIHLNFDQSQIPQETNIDQRSGVVLGTGLIDLYSTSSEPGHESKETISELVQAAKNGGFATIGILPNTQPAIDDIAALEFWRNVQQKHGNILQPWGAITKGLEGKQLTDIAELAESVIGFTDSKPISNLLLVRRAMEYIKPLGKHIALFPQNPDLTGTGVIREGKWSLQYGMTGYPAAAETTALAALIELVRLTKAPAHFMRLSTAQSVELIYQAKNDGLPVTASATWLHLCHCDRDLATYDPNLRLSPPLGSEGDRLALIAGIKSGVIDSIAIDHTPCAYEEKVVPFEVAPVGAIGLEFALPVLWQNLVISGLLTATELWQALSVNPAKILGLAPPKLSTLFEPCLEWLAKDSAISSQSRNSNYMGRSIIGKVLA